MSHQSFSIAAAPPLRVLQGVGIYPRSAGVKVGLNPGRVTASSHRSTTVRANRHDSPGLDVFGSTSKACRRGKRALNGIIPATFR